MNKSRSKEKYFIYESNSLEYKQLAITIPLSLEYNKRFIYLQWTNRGVWLQLYWSFKHNYGKHLWSN